LDGEVREGRHFVSIDNQLPMTLAGRSIEGGAASATQLPMTQAGRAIEGGAASATQLPMTQAGRAIEGHYTNLSNLSKDTCIIVNLNPYQLILVFRIKTKPINTSLTLLIVH
jgi:hypothetical protein